MKKLKLEIDALRVESFDAGSGAGRGTVEGRNWTADSCYPCEPIPPDDSIDYCSTVAPYPTCAATQCGSCHNTCAGTCGCAGTRYGWTCDPYATECLPVPEENPPL